MDAKTLGWLADTVNEAIATATAPLVHRVKELEAKLEAQAASVKTLLNPEVQDDTFYDDVWWKIEDRVKGLIPAPYDDTALVARMSKQLEALREQIPVAYDDAEIKGALVDAEMRLSAKQSQEVEAILNRIKDARYDDSALRETIAAVEQGLTSVVDAFGLTKKEVEAVKQIASERPTPADGRDALHLEVLPAIDEQKSYTRGTYAKHAGGLWRAFEQTSGMRGWECIVDGIASLTAEMHGKALVVRAIQSSGTEAILHAALPVQTYKGVFAHGEHEQGDTVTWAGSLWHCNVTGTKALPGDGSADWTLAVKKGRDGREVVKTERAEGPVHLTPLQFIDQLGR